MKRPDKLKWVKHLLMDWADREDRMMSQSVIGYPSKSVEGRMISPEQSGNGIKGPLCPEVMMTRRISHCNRAVKALKPELRQAIHYKYEESGNELEKAQRYIRQTGNGRTTYYDRLEKAHRAVADWVWRNV
ncbi:MAG: hypothetical protein PVJ68_15015 [Candidatus Thiodiazotropha sp.]|jgi:hypothetical protein